MDAEATAEAAEVPPSRLGRLQEQLLPPVDQLGEDGHPKPTRMTPREQLVGAGLGIANVAIAAGSTMLMEKQQALALLFGVVASAVTVVGARVGNRLVTIVGLFLSTQRFSNTTLFVALVLPYYGAAMWMFLRYNRLVKEQSIRRRRQRAEARDAGTTTPRPARTRGGAAATPKAAKRPPPSKRYTPPKPPKRRPPPPTDRPKDRKGSTEP